MGHVIDGFVRSLMVTLKVHDARFPEESITVYRSTVVPTGKLEPLGNPRVIVVVELQLSEPTGALNVKGILQYVRLLRASETDGGQLITGS